MGMRRQFVNNIVSPTWACAAGFNNNDEILKSVLTSTKSTVINKIISIYRLIYRIYIYIYIL